MNLFRIPAFYKHLETEKENNIFIKKMCEKETSIKHVATRICEVYNIDMNNVTSTKLISERIKKETHLQHKEEWLKKPVHGYLQRINKQVENVDKKYNVYVP